jgi:predicted nuclease with TOPRIM domain
MANVASTQTAPQTTAEYEAEFELLMQEAARLNESMDKEQGEIERLKAETQVLAKQTERLKTETRIMLVGMGAKL